MATKMAKEDWQDIHDKLRKLYGNINTREYQNGRNKKIRDKAERDLKSAINSFEYLIFNHSNPEVYNFFFETLDNNQFAVNEFLLPWYFEKDLKKFMDDMQKVIDSFKNDEEE